MRSGMPQAVLEASDLTSKDCTFTREVSQVSACSVDRCKSYTFDDLSVKSSSTNTEAIEIESSVGARTAKLGVSVVPDFVIDTGEERSSDHHKTFVNPLANCASSWHLLSTGVLNTADKCSHTLQDRAFQMGYSKDTGSIYNDKCTAPLKSCILIPKGDGSGEKIQVKKAKSVHFADSLGKPLKSVVTMLTDEDEFDLSLLGLKSFSSKRTFLPPTDLLMGCKLIGDYKEDRGKLLNFKQPVQRPDFLERVLQSGVSVENVVFREYGIFVTVTVSNMHFEKQVCSRYTADNWTTACSLVAGYVQGSSTGKTDTFSFEIPITGSGESDTEIQFAVAYETDGKTFWDNNSGKNYAVTFYRKSLKDKRELASSAAEEGFLLSQHSFVGWPS